MTLAHFAADYLAANRRREPLSGLLQGNLSRDLRIILTHRFHQNLLAVFIRVISVTLGFQMATSVSEATESIGLLGKNVETKVFEQFAGQK